ncbi:hypothetical protein KQX54_019147 [Cotesia glomerata]|uniref:Uncharacterized protein n=1 Tax=Cotesia glomerata TaxID=32391 RepID=A0AAV7I469_COTGL|nr:hypothetical protein KQX54_019147 [Cotesia glomerata]
MGKVGEEKYNNNNKNKKWTTKKGVRRNRCTRQRDASFPTIGHHFTPFSSSISPIHSTLCTFIRTQGCGPEKAPVPARFCYCSKALPDPIQDHYMHEHRDEDDTFFS